MKSIIYQLPTIKIVVNMRDILNLNISESVWLTQFAGIIK